MLSNTLVNPEKMSAPILNDLLECFELHCLWCCDCDFDNNPDESCKFGKLWNELRKNGILEK